MYDIYLDRMLIPINPTKISIKSKNKNEVVNLINSAEVNILKTEGLKDISLQIVLPAFKYPFLNTMGGYHKPQYYLDKLKRLKANRKPFQFIISRRYLSNKSYFNTNIKVSLESYSVSDDTNEFMDIIVDIELKEYKDPRAKQLNLMLDGISGYVTMPRAVTTIIDQIHTTKEGELLWQFCRSKLGGVEKMGELMALNGLKKATDFVGGQVVRCW